ncbi:MAG: bifunctional hydroxymethylpyrimidine kinase/phosphomethylpyrimidine kinase [Nannocystaceae bacterium]|nr:bifunctional hydroxymethylpyrimidine kinase/phosphomethylpyrimidine kinase [Nannocystaceae bacterium]
MVALSVAGSDSGGGAGIQMDLRVLQRMGVLATTAITAVTAQNLNGVQHVAGVGPESLAAQLAAVLSGFDVAAIKTGMLWSAPLIEVLATALNDTDVPLVIDPVMIATSGARLLDPAAVRAYKLLWPRAALVTPNLDEATELLGVPIDPSRMTDAAERLADKLQCAVLLKGGHLEGPPCDVLATGSETASWSHARIESVNTHGSGCLLSAAITARLALGDPLLDACEVALSFTHDALARGAEQGAPYLAAVELASSERAHLRRVL